MGDKRYNVELTYSTRGSSADDALGTACYAFGQRASVYAEVFEDGSDAPSLDGEVGALASPGEPLYYPSLNGHPDQAHNQYNVVFSYTTHESDAKAALDLALQVFGERSGGYLEIFKEEEKESVLEGELGEILLKPATPFDLDLVFNPDEGSLTQESSSRLKTAFNTYFAEHGVPDQAQTIENEAFRELAKEYGEEFGEACEQFEQYGAFKV
jgi:hypothetical protein